MKYDVEAINKRKQKAKIFKKLIEIIAIVIIYNVILLGISYANKLEGADFFGYKAYIIKSDSMEKEISPGDVIITKKVGRTEIQKGDVITFLQNGEVITHRVTNIEKIAGQKEYTTKGDNNNIEDSTKVSYKDIQGKKVLTIPYLGKIVQVLENQIVVLVIILVILIDMFIKIQREEKIENRREKKKIEASKKEKE